MEPSDLAFYTTQELIDELVHRATFLGVVIHSGQELRDQDWSQETLFKVRFNSNLSNEEASHLLGTVSRHLDGTCSESE
jgi:hypothetical protein